MGSKTLKNSNKEEIEVKDRKTSIGVAIPMSGIGDCTKEHWDEVYKIIESSFDKEIYDISIVSKSNEMAVIQNAIVNNLYYNDIVICDVSCGNPNVMFELGMRLAFDKPTIVVKDFETPYTFDSSPIRHIEYPRSLHYQSIIDFKNKIKSAVEQTLSSTQKDGYRSFLSNFGDLKAAKVEDHVVPENEYIIKRLDGLYDRLDRIDRNNTKNKNLSRSIYPGTLSEDELLVHIRSLIDKYCEERNINLIFEKELARSLELEIKTYVYEHLTGGINDVHGLLTLPCSNNQFENAFQQAYMGYVHPF
ncbi:RNA helicase [Vibrio parahaemolyticus]